MLEENKITVFLKMTTNLCSSNPGDATLIGILEILIDTVWVL